MKIIRGLISNITNRDTGYTDKSLSSLPVTKREANTEARPTNPSFKEILDKFNFSAVPAFDREFVAPWTPEEALTIKQYINNPVVVAVIGKLYAVDLIALKRKPSYFTFMELSGLQTSPPKKLVIVYNQQANPGEPLFYVYYNNDLARALYQTQSHEELIGMGIPVNINPAHVRRYADLPEDIKQIFPISNQLSNRRGSRDMEG